jgi:hypothetical protein
MTTRTVTMSKAYRDAARNKFQPKVGDRITYVHLERGGYSLGLGEIVKLNRATVMIIDRKFEGNQQIGVDRALIRSIVDPA